MSAEKKRVGACKKGLTSLQLIIHGDFNGFSLFSGSDLHTIGWLKLSSFHSRTFAIELEISKQHIHTYGEVKVEREEILDM